MAPAPPLADGGTLDGLLGRIEAAAEEVADGASATDRARRMAYGRPGARRAA